MSPFRMFKRTWEIRNKLPTGCGWPLTTWEPRCWRGSLPRSVKWNGLGRVWKVGRKWLWFCHWCNDLKSILWLFFVHYKTDNYAKEKMFSTVCHPSNIYFNWNTPSKYNTRNSIDGSLCDLIRRISELSLDGSKNRILQFGQRIKSGTTDDCNLDQEKSSSGQSLHYIFEFN